MNSEKEAKIINILNKAEQIRNNNKSILDAKLGKIKSGYIICIGGSFVGMIIGIIWGFKRRRICCNDLWRIMCCNRW